MHQIVVVRSDFPKLRRCDLFTLWTLAYVAYVAYVPWEVKVKASTIKTIFNQINFSINAIELSSILISPSDDIINLRSPIQF